LGGPLKTYPAGYHCAGSPLPFINLASQKNFIALYHMGLYSTPELLDWFVAEYPKHSKKNWIWENPVFVLKKVEDIPFELIAELSRKMTVEDWISSMNLSIKKKSLEFLQFQGFLFAEGKFETFFVY
jgi:hypothetical protein